MLARIFEWEKVAHSFREEKQLIIFRNYSSHRQMDAKNKKIAFKRYRKHVLWAILSTACAVYIERMASGYLPQVRQKRSLLSANKIQGNYIWNAHELLWNCVCSSSLSLSFYCCCCDNAPRDRAELPSRALVTISRQSHRGEKTFFYPAHDDQDQRAIMRPRKHQLSHTPCEINARHQRVFYIYGFIPPLLLGEMPSSPPLV